MNLYEIANEYQNILEETFDHETGEINEKALAKLDEIKTDIKTRGIAVASYIRNLQAEQEAIQGAKKAMAEREARIERRISHLNSYLQSNMERIGMSEISCPYFVIKLKKNPVSVDVYDQSILPFDFIKTKEVITQTVDKIKIKEEILKGTVIPGAALKQNYRLEIR